MLDRFVDGEPVDIEDLQDVWRDTTQPGAFDSPVYEKFLRAVREANSYLLRHARLRVLAADYPINWDTVSGPSDLDAPMRNRDQFAATIIRQEVLERKRKALVLFGSAHLYRNRPGTIVDLLKDVENTKCFVVVPVGGPELPGILTSYEASAQKPQLIRLSDTEVKRLRAAEVLEIGTKRIKMIDGKPVFQDGKPVFIPVFEDDIELGDLADACLDFGRDEPEFIHPRTELYGGTEYGREVHRRRTILHAAMSGFSA